MSDPPLNEEALGTWLGANVPGFKPPFRMTKFPSGQSNPTYLIEAASGEYVLRRKPFGPLLQSAHAVDREYRLLSALSPLGFPVPRPLALCADPDVIGAIFYVMEKADGRAYADGSLPGFDPDARQRTYFALVDALADLHSIDPDGAGVSDFGRPGNYSSARSRGGRGSTGIRRPIRCRKWSSSSSGCRHAAATVADVDRPR